MTNRLKVLLLILLSPCVAQAELPKAITVSPMAIPPGRTSTVAVHGLNLTDATELWTNLDASVRKVEAPGSTLMSVESALAEGRTPPLGALVVEAEAFDRGQYGKSGTFILNGNFSPNFAEWDFQIESARRFVLELNYASGESRPVSLFLNGELLTENAAAGKTGGFGGDDARWMVECIVDLKKGTNTLRLERSGGTPHFDKLALVPTELPATRFSTVVPTERIAPFEIDVAENCPIGIRGLRVATREGISNLLLFMVDDLPTQNEIRGRNSNGLAQQIELPVAIEGYCDAGTADRYEFQVEAGESVSIEAVASRLGTKLDPVIRLLKADGTELAFVDDSPGLAGDCSLRHTFSESGKFIVTIEDALMSGASGHGYRLRIGDFPLMSTAVPAAVFPEVATSLAFSGAAVDSLPTVTVTTSDDLRTPVSASFAGKIGSGFTEVAASRTPHTVLSTDRANVPVTIPHAFSGILKTPGEQHSCLIAASKGNRIRILDVSRSQGVPAVLAMTVRDQAGRTLAQIRKGGPAGAELIWSVPADGTFELLISDVTGRGGSEFGYHVEVTEDTPGFQLTVDQDSTILPENGYTLLKVNAVRKGYNGSINLSVSGLGDQIKLLNNTIEEKAKDTRLKIYLPSNYRPGQTSRLIVTGTATIADATVIRTASTLAVLRKSLPQNPFPQGNLDGLIAATVGPAIPEFFALSVDDGAVLFPRFVGEVYFTVRVRDRAEGFKAPVNLRVEGLPEGFSVSGGENAVSRSDDNEYRFQLRGPVELEQAVIPLRVIAEASFKGQTREVELSEVPLKVIDPLLITVASDSPFKPGVHGRLKIQVRRFVPRAGGDKKLITVEFGGVPAGISLPTTVSIPAGADNTFVEFSIAPDVDFRAVPPVKITATTVVADRPVVALTMLPLQPSSKSAVAP